MSKLKIRTVADGLFELNAEATSAFLIADGDALYLIDAGWLDWGPKISEAIESLGFQLSQLKGVCVTHSHPDHAGGLAYLQKEADFETVMHPVDAEMVQQGKTKRTLRPSPGIIHWLIFQTYIKTSPFVMNPGEVDRLVEDGDTIPWAGHMQVVHLPGHAAGQIGLLWNRHGGVFFVADAAVNILGLSEALASEDDAVMRESLTKICGFDFEIACFGHGRVIKGGAGMKFRRKWGG